MSFIYNKSAAKIGIKVEQNKRTGLSNQACQIINVFIHEKQHYDDYKTLGYDKYKSLDIGRKERRAVITQMNHDSYKNTSDNFKKNTMKYGDNYGLPRKIQLKNAGF